MQTRVESTVGEPVHITSPGRLITGVPYLLGFLPTNSAVLVWTENDLVVLTMRVDLPAPDEHMSPERWASETIAAAVHSRSRFVHVIVFTDEEPAGDAPCLPLAMNLVREAEARDIGVGIASTVCGDRVFLHPCDRCDGPQCGGHATPPDPLGDEMFRAHFAPPAQSRNDVLAEFRSSSVEGDSAPHIAEHLHELDAIRTARAGHRRLETWRDEAIGAVLRTAGRAPELSVGGAVHTPDEIALTTVALGDIRCRDAVLWDLSMPGKDLRSPSALLLSVVRQAPARMVAGPATVLAVIMWLRGDGLRAKVACQRALECDPYYSLAVLLDAALSAGLPPAVWHQVVSDLSYAECRGSEMVGARDEPTPAAGSRS